MNFKELESTEKLRGGYYTDLDIALFLSRWIGEINPESLLEPACGDGAFFRALSKSPIASLNRITGLEVIPKEAARASEALTEVIVPNKQVINNDFLGWAIQSIHKSETFDAVIGNPPFIRYQYLPEDAQQKAQTIFALFHLRFTKHTNAWVPFIIASLALLRPGGRLAMVVPSEIFHVLHAQSLRDYLVSVCHRVMIFDPEELLFPTTLQGAVLLLAEKKDKRSADFGGLAVISLANRSFLTDDPRKEFTKGHFVNGKTIVGKWMTTFLTDRERRLLADLRERTDVCRFVDVADVDVGIVTGANKYFLVPDSIVEKFRLQKWAHPMFGRSQHVQGVVYDENQHNENRSKGLPTNFLWFDPQPQTRYPKKVQQYFEQGEAEKIHTRYKCRVRSPWYTVPSVYSTSVGMLKRCHHYPRLILNEIGAFTTDTAYRVTSRKILDHRLVFSFINSLTALTAELEGRHYGGGVLELVPSEIEKVLLPIVRTRRSQLIRLNSMVQKNTSKETVFDAQDKALLLDGLCLSKEEASLLRSAGNRLRLRRQRATH